jgi:type III secretion system-like peptide-binding chaperone
MAKPEALAVLRQTVDGFLRKSFDEVRVDRFGDFHVRPGGVTTWIQARSLGEEQTAVLVWSPSNIGMTVDAGLTGFLATEANELAFGQFELHDCELPRMHVSHALLGEFLSGEELAVAVEAVAEASARYGPIVKERFGGRLAAELEIRAGEPIPLLDEIADVVERTGRWPPEPARPSRVRRAVVFVLPAALAVGVVLLAYQWLGS